MAQRLATEYVKTCLVLTELQFQQLLELFRSHSLNYKVKVLDSGDHEILMEDSSGSALTLTFERKNGIYVLEGSCRFTDLKLANAMRKAVSQFKGHAVVNRIYPYHSMEYQYSDGAVVRITERSRHGERLVYERKDTLNELRKTFFNTGVEAQIQLARIEINEWLDRRNVCKTQEARRAVDEQLRRLAYRLFVLEA